MLRVKNNPSFCRFFLLFVGALFFTYTAEAKEPIPVIIGGYIYEPFVNVDQKSGLTFDLIEALNKVQQKYKFSFISLPARRRYQMVNTGKINGIFFESDQWQWKDQPAKIVTTQPIVKVSELYVSQAGRNPSVFNMIKSRKIAIIKGYHYAFSGFNSDPHSVSLKYSLRQVYTLDQVMRLITKRQVDIGVVNDAYLAQLVASKPEVKKSIMIADEVDATYHLPILLSASSPVSAAEMNNYLKMLKKAGTLEKILPGLSVLF